MDADPDAFGPTRPPASPPPQPPQPPVAGGDPGFVFVPGYGYLPGVVQPVAPVLPPVSEAVLKIPLGTRELIRQSLDLLTRSDSGLRGPSFYIGFLLLVTFGPFAVILGLALTTGAIDQTEPSAEFPAWALWMLLSIIPALLGYIAAQAEAAGMATAVIGGRVEGRPLGMRQSIAIARRRFWSILGPRLLANVIAGVIGFVLTIVLFAILGFAAGDAIGTGASLVISLIVSAPFVYVPAGVVLGEVSAWEAIERSVKLVLRRKRLAIVVTLFGVFSQFIIGFGVSIGADVVARVLTGAGLVDSVPVVLVVPIAAALVFALGTLTFLVEAIAAAPAVHAFAALTHYTHGLEVGRRQPVAGRHLWDPWVTPGLALTGLLGLVSLVGGVLSLTA